MVLPYLSSAQQDLTNNPQESIRQPITMILALNLTAKIVKGPRSAGELTGLNTGELVGMAVISAPIVAD